jgi:hypothetical protein
MADGITQANAALASAHKALDAAGNSSVGTKSGHSNFSPKPTPAASRSDYSHVRASRPGGGSFMGIKADQGSELKAANEAHDNAVKALNQQ